MLFGDDGAARTLPKGATVILHTTGAPEDAIRIAARLAETGHLMIDAPVTGGKIGADEGTLTIIASGSDSAFAAAEPAFKAMGRNIYRVGSEIGQASTVKMVNQLLVGIHGVAMAEAMALATRAGADPKTVYEVITHGAGNSSVFEGLAPMVLAGEYEPRGNTDILTKDLGIVSEASRRLNLPLPLAAAALQQFLAAKARGDDPGEVATVARVYEALAGINISETAGKTET